MQISLAKFIAFFAFLSTAAAAADDCCLCDGCLPLEPSREGAYVYDDFNGQFNTCESLAWELMKHDAQDKQCTDNQLFFRETCCTANPLVVAQPTTNDKDLTADTRKLWGSTSWGKPATSSFSSSPAWNTPSTSRVTPSSSAWGSNNNSGGASCSICSDPSNGSLGIVVNGPGFQYTGPCRGLNGALRQQNIGTSHQMCGATIARFRHDCQCGGPQNNAASFFGQAPNNSGVNSWCIKGFTC